ncbi:MAG: glycoside hydrolase family 3 C-terminal domain-containing protein [Kiritimatiellae bacterium]|nr:glycoside hydrolase family 3 C-terminal domain-containing protein [Kiritimatiellia bacterium]
MTTANIRFAALAAAALAATNCLAMLSDKEAEKAARETLAKMTLEEKVLLSGGSGTMTLSAIPRVGIMKEWTMSDNSSTVRPTMDRWTWDYTKPRSVNTKLPSLSALAQTWDPEMARLHGEVLGAEMRDRGVDELLGPGVNIARTPLNGRNWEYLGEDPCLAAKMCVPMIRGVQSYDVAATVKHFCLNDQEWNRNTVDTHCDLRTLHEIYLPAFRAAVQEAGVLCVMTSYNKIDGLWASENKYLQTGVLRDRWGFKGLLETDWGGQHSNEFSANNGGGIEMDRGDQIKHHFNPKEGKTPLLDAVKAGKVSVATVDEMTLHVLYVMAKTGFLTGAPRRAGSRNTKEHQEAARRIGEESIVLAKNDKGVLPLDAKSLRKVLVLGKNANNPQCGKGCSGEGNVPYEVSFIQGLRNILGKDVEIGHRPLPQGEVQATDNSALAVDLSGVERAGGHVEKDAAKAGGGKGPGLDELKALALASDATIVFTGTELGYDGNMESEGRDRKNMLSDPGEDDSVAAVLSWDAKNTVVVSRAGTPVGYTWTDSAPTLLMSSYLGMEEGNAIARVVFGDVNPSGKLCQTWPKRYEDTGVAQMGTYNGKEVVYNERFYVGYRWFDYKDIEPMFPFGHGLSYTKFDVSSVGVEGAKDGGWTVSAKVTNTGKVAGREVVQVYVAYPMAKVERCVKDLRGFAKTKLLAPGESETVRIPITLRDLARFDELDHRFVTDEGVYELLVGTSSRNILRKKTVAVGETRF